MDRRNTRRRKKSDGNKKKAEEKEAMEWLNWLIELGEIERIKLRNKTKIVQRKKPKRKDV